jgi:hypothetical protein
MTRSKITNGIRSSARSALILDMLSNSDQPSVRRAFAPRGGMQMLVLEGAYMYGSNVDGFDSSGQARA